MPEAEEEEKEIENLFEQIMKENFSNLEKELDIQVHEAQRVLKHAQAHQPRNQHKKGPICTWVAGEMTESPASSIVPSQTSTPPTAPQHIEVSYPTRVNTQGSAPYHGRGVLRQGNKPK